MMPGRYPMMFYRGDSYKWRVVIWLDAQRQRPFDMTGMVTKAEIRPVPTGFKAWLIDTTITLPNIVDLSLPADVCHELPDECVWDLQFTTSAADVFTVLRGNVQVVDDVTDSRETAVINPPPPRQRGGLMAFPKRGMGIRVA